MKISMMTQLLNADQRGGAYLRVHAIDRIYKSLGFQTKLLYQENFQSNACLWGHLRSFYYGTQTRVLFRKVTAKIEDADFIHLDNLRHLEWNYPKNRPIIFNAHNLEFENFFNRKASIKSLRFKKFELNQMNKAKCIWVCSQREKILIDEGSRELGIPLDRKTFVIPNLVASENYHTQKKKYISFIGTLDYYPNMQALDYLFSTVFHKDAPSLPQGLSFLIAGRNPSKLQIETANQHGIEIRSDLTQDEILKVFSETKILLVPLIEGSGTRLKIIEGIFSKCQILSTPIGAEGIESNLIEIADISNFQEKFNHLLGTENSLQEKKPHEDFYNHNDLNSWIKLNSTKIKQAILR